MKKLLAIAAVASVLFSCSKTPNPEPEPKPEPSPVPEKWAIKIAPSITKVTDSAFENGDKVGIYVVNDPNTLKSSGNHVDNLGFTYSGTWTSSSTAFWKDETTKADFYCYFPYVAGISNTEEHSFEVKADQSTEANYKASDFLWGKTAGATPTKNAVSINMYHKMSYITVKLVAGDGYTDEDLKNASVTICGLKTKSSINLATGAVSAAGDAHDITPLAGNGQLRALVVPQSVKDIDIIKVTVGDTTYKLNQSIELKSGTQHTCTLTVDRSGQGINISIGGWEISSEDFGGTVE